MCSLGIHVLVHGSMRSSAAPRVFLDDGGYCGRAVDAWSLGVVMLERVCRLGILNRISGLPGGEAPQTHAKNFRLALGEIETSLKLA